MTEVAQPRRPDEHGVPDPFPYMHPLLKKNYGQWAWHDRPRPGVLHHVAHGGDEVWTVRAGTQRQMDVFTLRTTNLPMASCDLQPAAMRSSCVARWRKQYRSSKS